MPRKARIDAAGALHHIIVKGIERRRIFYDDNDRGNFLKRLGTLWSIRKHLVLPGRLIQTTFACYCEPV